MEFGYLFVLLSAFLLICSWLFYANTQKTILKSLVLLVASFVSVFLLIVYLLSDYFTGNGVDDSVVYHVFYGFEGAGILEYLAPISMALFSLLILFFLAYRFIFSEKKLVSKFGNTPLALIFITLSLSVNPALIDIISLSGTKDTDDFEKYYQMPKLTSSGDHKNLVFISAESLERTYFDEKLFPGLLPNLKRLEKEAFGFSNIKQLPATGWTVAGLTANTCGIPLVATSQGNLMGGMNDFLSSAVCIGDLLKEEGYQLIFNGGADISFAGKGRLFETHGFDRVSGLEELLPRLSDSNYLNHWGLNDDSLFDINFEDFLHESSKNSPFALFTLTLGTHHPEGHMSKACLSENITYADGENPMLNAVACSDFLISRFIEKIIASEYGENTVIVLASDHLAMNNSARKQLLAGDRKNLFMIFSSDIEAPAVFNNIGSTMDLAPTFMPFVGYNLSLGLGRNLLSTNTVLAKEISYIHENIKSWFSSMMQFWMFPILDSVFEYDYESQSVKVGRKEFNLPVILELDDDFSVIPRFAVREDGADGFSNIIENLAEEHAFIYARYCKGEAAEEIQTCLSLGRVIKY